MKVEHYKSCIKLAIISIEGGCAMPLKFKMDILGVLRAKGYTTYRIRKDKLLSESTVQKLRSNGPVSWENIETICRLLNCQPGDLLEYLPDEK